MLKIDLLRHGESILSHTLRGSTDDELTLKGWQQMQQSIDQALTCEWNAIYSSPLKRCQSFARHLAQQHLLNVYIEPQLQEMHFGDWEAISTQEIYEKYPEDLAKFWQQPTQFTPPQAESIQLFQHRVEQAMLNIQRHMQQQNWNHVLLVTHGGVIKLLKCLAMNKPIDDILSMPAALGQLSTFTWNELGKLEYREPTK